MKINLGKLVDEANRDWRDSKDTMSIAFNSSISSATRFRAEKFLVELRKFKEEL